MNKRLAKIKDLAKILEIGESTLSIYLGNYALSKYVVKVNTTPKKPYSKKCLHFKINEGSIKAFYEFLKKKNKLEIYNRLIEWRNNE